MKLLILNLLSAPDAPSPLRAACAELAPDRCRRRPASEISGTAPRSSRRGRWRASGYALLLHAALAGCSAYGGKSLQPVTSDVLPAATVSIRPPDAIVEPLGLRFHGWVCRARLGITPHALRVERIDAAGQVTDSAHGRVNVGPRLRSCSIYDIPTDWSLGTGETIRICASGDSKACPTQAP